MDSNAPAIASLGQLVLDHLLLILAPIVILLVVRKKWPFLFEGKWESWAVFYPAPMSIGGALLGLSSYEDLEHRVAAGIVCWGLSALLFKVAQPLFKRFLSKTFVS